MRWDTFQQDHHAAANQRHCGIQPKDRRQQRAQRIDNLPMGFHNDDHGRESNANRLRQIGQDVQLSGFQVRIDNFGC